MKDLTFSLACVNAELPAIQLDNGSWLLHAHLTWQFAEVAKKDHAARWIKDNEPKKWLQEFKRPDQVGRPALYLLLSGFLFTLSQGNSEVALDFRDEVYEVILPAIIEQGGYLAPEASSTQIQALTLNHVYEVFKRDEKAGYSLIQDMYETVETLSRRILTEPGENRKISPHEVLDILKDLAEKSPINQGQQPLEIPSNFV